MVQLGIGRKDGAVASFPHAQAKVSVVKTDGKFLVVAADLLKYVASHHLTGTCYGAKVTRTYGAGKIALALCREILVGMGKCATHTNQYASVLHQMVGKVEFGAHHARIGTLQIAHHLFNKVGTNDLGIVVEQQQIIAFGVLHAKVNDLGVIELTRPVHNARDALAFGCCSHALWQGFVIRKRLRGFAVVLHQDDLVIGIRCLLGDRHHTGVKRLNVILGGNHNAHQRRRLRQRIAHAVDKRRLGILNRSANAQRVKVALQRKTTGFNSIRLAIGRAIGGRSRMHAPVIQHMRNMLKPRVRRKAAKRQVVVLGTRNVFRGRANTINERLLHHQEMRHAVMAIEQVDVELSLKDRLAPLPRFLEHVLVAEQDLGTLALGSLVQRGNIVE